MPEGRGEETGVVRTYQTMEEVMRLVEKFPFCSLEFMGYLDVVSDEDIKQLFHSLKEVIVAAGVFRPGTSMSNKFLMTSRVMFNRMSFLEKIKFAKHGLRHVRLKAKRKVNGICDDDDHRDVVRETVALTAEAWKAVVDVECQQASSDVACPLCEGAHQDHSYKNPVEFVEHLDEHQCLTLHGCHMCRHLFTSKDAFEHHSCQEEDASTSKRPRIEREVRTSYYLLACTGCGHSMNVFASASGEAKKEQMEAIKALRLSHHSSQLIAVLIHSTDKRLVKEDLWKVEFTLRSGDFVSLPKECCEVRFDHLQKFKEHVFNHLTDKGKMAAFLEATDKQKKQTEACSMTSEVENGPSASSEDPLKATLQVKFPSSWNNSWEFHTHVLTKPLPEMQITDLHISTNSVEPEPEYKVYFQFAPMRPKEAITTTIVSRTFMCFECRMICVGDVAATAHFKECSQSEKENELPKDFLSSHFEPLVPCFALPNASVQCSSCEVVCCSLYGLQTHLALRHNCDVKICGLESSPKNWLHRTDPNLTAMSINTFCGLTPEGLLAANLNACHVAQLPMPKFGKARTLRRRANIFLHPPDLTEEEKEMSPEVPVVPDAKETNNTVLLDRSVETSVAETAGSSVEETINDFTMTEEKTKDEEEAMEDGEIRDDEEPTEAAMEVMDTTIDVMETAFSEEATVVEQEQENTATTSEIEEPVPVVPTEIEKTIDDTMQMFAGPSDTAINTTMDMFPPAENKGPTTVSDTESAMRVAQLWDEGRKSRETPPAQEKIDFGSRCFDCGLLLKDEETLTSHLEAHGSGSAPLLPLCHLCPEETAFQDSTEYMQHLCNEHATIVEKNNGSAFQCKFCEREFPSHVLVAHLIFDCNHSPCGLCKEQLQNMIHIEREKHRKNHRVYKRFVCHCKLGFPNFVLFNNHVCAHEEKKLVQEALSRDLLIGVVPEHPSMNRILEDATEANNSMPAEMIRASDTITIVEHAAADLADAAVIPSTSISGILNEAARGIFDTLLPPPPLPPILNGAPSPALSTASSDSVDSTIVSSARDVNRRENGAVPEAPVVPDPEATPSQEEDEDDIQILDAPQAVSEGSGQQPAAARADDTEIEVVERAPSTSSVAWKAVEDDDDEIQMAEMPSGSRTTTTGREKRFKCNLCSAAFLTQNSLENHSSMMHSSDISDQEKLCHEDHGVPMFGQMWLCMLCSAAFDNMPRHVQHMRTHEGRRHLNITCQDCSGLQLSLENLRSHRNHHATKSLRYRCIQCTPHVVFTEDAAYMMHQMEVHNQRILFYCKNCFYSSCEHNLIYPHVKRRCCQTVHGGLEGIGFALANQVNYQPTNEAQYKLLVSANPDRYVKPTPCSHKNFLRFGIKFTSCPDPDSELGLKCMGLVNYNTFENQLRSQHGDRQLHLEDFPEDLVPKSVNALPGYDLHAYLKHVYENQPAAQFRISQTPPIAALVNRPANPRSNGCSASGRIAAGAGTMPPALPQVQQPIQQTPQRQRVPIPVPSMPRPMVPGMQSPMHFFNAQQHAAMYGAAMPGAPMPMQQMQMQQRHVQQMQMQQRPVQQGPIQQMSMQQRPAQQIPMQQMPQAPQAPPLQIVAHQMGINAPFMTCVVCDNNGIMPPIYMVTLPETKEGRTKAFNNIMKGTEVVIPDQMAQDIRKRLDDPLARLCWRHVNPHSVRLQNGQAPSIDVENVCFDYSDFTKGILKNPQEYQNLLQLFAVHSREPHLRFNFVQAVSTLLARNVCSFESCGKVLASNAIVNLHRSHTDRELKHACFLCKNVYETSESVFIHLLSAHFPNIKNVRYELRCPMCTVEPIKDLKLYLYHLKKQHSAVLKEPSIYCPSYSFACVESQQHHDKLHAEAEAYKNGGECCCLCGHANALEKRAFPALANLSQLNHVEIQHSLQWRYSCRLCLEDFSMRAELVDHLTKKHGYGRRITDWKCSLCADRVEDLLEHATTAHTVMQYRLAVPDHETLVVVVDAERLHNFLGIRK